MRFLDDKTFSGTRTRAGVCGGIADPREEGGGGGGPLANPLEGGGGGGALLNIPGEGALDPGAATGADAAPPCSFMNLATTLAVFLS